MKKIYITLLIAILTFNLQLSTSNCNAQNTVTIPDTAFVSWLQNDSLLMGCITGNQLDTTCPEVLSRKTIAFTFINLTNLTGIQYFKNLDTLICAGNALTALINLPDSIKLLDCSGNQIDTFPVLPPFISTLYCYNNNLDSLPALPATLTNLNCSYNFFTDLPQLPASLNILNCYTDELNSLPVLPATLTYLDCSDNNLDTLPVLPSLLRTLSCGLNQFTTTLPALPTSLVTLYCGLNQLITLPTLPTFLNYLDCDNNQIAYLPTLPYYLNYIDCSGNLLTGMPTIVSSLRFIECGSNNLTSLSVLPDSLYELDISNNSNFTCLPTINKINTFFFSGTNIQCVPDYGQVDTSTPLIDSLPLCSVSNPANCYSVAGVKQLEVGGWKLEVFPNPTSGNFTISSSAELNNAVVEIDNVLGESVFSTRLMTQDTPISSGQARPETIDISELASGIYFIRVSTAGETQTVKVIKE